MLSSEGKPLEVLLVRRVVVSRDQRSAIGGLYYERIGYPAFQLGSFT